MSPGMLSECQYMPFVYVLNSNVRRASLPTRYQLVHRTGKQVKPMLKELIVRCCDLFKSPAGDENRRGRKRKRRHKDAALVAPAVPTPATPSKNEFMQYLCLNAKGAKTSRPAKVSPVGMPRLPTTPHIPVSSDAGRLMTAREKHLMSEHMKLRRLERSEWYINKGDVKGGTTTYSALPCKKVPHCHEYKMPKRQQHQKSPSLNDAEFLLKFCKPLSVRLTRFDEEKTTHPSDLKHCRPLSVCLKRFDEEKNASPTNLSLKRGLPSVYLTQLNVEKRDRPKSLFVRLTRFDVEKNAPLPEREVKVSVDSAGRMRFERKLRGKRVRETL